MEAVRAEAPRGSIWPEVEPGIAAGAHERRLISRELVMTYSPSEPTLQRAKEMLDAARQSPMGRRLSESGFNLDMEDPEEANALAMHVLHQLQVLDATTRMLAGAVQTLQTRMSRSEALFL